MAPLKMERFKGMPRCWYCAKRVRSLTFRAGISWRGTELWVPCHRICFNRRKMEYPDYEVEFRNAMVET